MPSEPGPARRGYGALSYLALPNCSYCGKKGHNDKSCWKKMRGGKNCGFCGSMGIERDGRWTKWRLERHDSENDERESVTVIQDLAPSAKKPIAAARRESDEESLPKQRAMDRSDFTGSPSLLSQKRFVSRNWSTVQALSSVRKTKNGKKNTWRKKKTKGKKRRGYVEHYEALASPTTGERGYQLWTIIAGRNK